MPFLPKFFKDDEEENQNQSNISGTSTSFDLPGANQASNTPKAPKKSGSWTNLNQYLDSNKEQAGAMADKVSSGIDSVANQASSKIEQVKSSAPGAIEQLSADKIRTDYLDRAQQLDDAQKNQYNTLKSTGGYSGPSDIYQIDGFTDAQSLTSKADQQLKQSKTEGGRQELLKETYKRPTYTQGQSTLDNLLVQNDPNSRVKFNEVQNKWSGLNEFLGTAQNDISSTIQDNISKAYQNKSLLPNVEQTYVDEFLNPIQQRATEANIINPELIQNILNDTKDETLSEDTLAKLGLATGSKIYDLDLSSYVTPDYTLANADNMATAEERGKYLALMKLIGADASAIKETGKSFDPVTFDSAKFNADLASKDAEFKNAYENQTGTVLNTSYLLNPNVQGGYDSYIPGGLTDNRNLSVVRIEFDGAHYFSKPINKQLQQVKLMVQVEVRFTVTQNKLFVSH